MSNVIKQIKIHDTVYDLRDNSILNKIYSVEEEPLEANDGDLWLDLDAEPEVPDYVTEEQFNNMVGDIKVSEQIDNAVAEKSRVQIIKQDVSEFLPTLNIYKLTQAEYDEKLANGEIDENVLYLTPDEEIDLSPYATEEYVDLAISKIPTPDVSGQIQAHNTAADAHTDLRDAVAANEAALSLLLNGSDPNTIDSVNDLINYVNKHGSEVVGIQEDIQTNTDDIAELKNKVGNNTVTEQINAAIENIEIPEQIYTQDEAPVDAQEGALWLDTDERAAVSGGVAADAVLYIEQELAEEQKIQARMNIGAASANEIGNIAAALEELHAYALSFNNAQNGGATV